MSKTIIVNIDDIVSKDRALGIAFSKIKVKKHYILREIDDGEIVRWLIASELNISENQAWDILKSLDSKFYSSEELDSIFNHVPFDIKISLQF